MPGDTTRHMRRIRDASYISPHSGLYGAVVLCEHIRVMHACCTMTMLQNWHTPCHHNVHVFTDCAEAVVILSGVGPRDSCANLPCTFNLDCGNKLQQRTCSSCPEPSLPPPSQSKLVRLCKQCEWGTVIDHHLQCCCCILQLFDTICMYNANNAASFCLVGEQRPAVSAVL